MDTSAPKEAKNGSLAWLLQKAVEERIKRQKEKEEAEKIELVRVKVLERGVAVDTADDDLNSGNRIGLEEALNDQVNVVRSLRRSLAEEFKRLSSNSTSENSGLETTVVSPTTLRKTSLNRTSNIYLI